MNDKSYIRQILNNLTRAFDLCLIRLQLHYKLKPTKRVKILECSCCGNQEDIVKRKTEEENIIQLQKLMQYTFTFDNNCDIAEILCPKCTEVLEQIKEELRLKVCCSKLRPPVEFCEYCNIETQKQCFDNDIAIELLKEKIRNKGENKDE